MPDNKIAVIADDLTGATDTGVQFLKNNFKTVVVFNSEKVKQLAKNQETIVVTTESRNLPPEDARGNIKKFICKLKSIGINKVYKKVDSTLRGNIGAELDEMLKILEKKSVFIIPAYPENNRITHKGVQYVGDSPLTETEYAEDFLAPVNHSYIPDILEEQGIYKNEIENISLEQIYNANQELINILKKKIRAGKKYFIFDSKDRKDLKLLADMIKSFPEDPVICGCAGFAEEIDKIWELKSPHIKEKKENNSLTDKKNKTESNNNSEKQKIIIIAGSVKKTTKDQITYAREQEKINIITLKTDQLLNSEITAKKELKRTKNIISTLLSENCRLIICLKKLKMNKSPENVIKDSKIIMKYLKQISSFIVDNFTLKGLILTGGDTASGICQEINADGIYLSGEVSPGIPAGKIAGGDLSQKFIVTKAGGFGNKEDLVQAVKYIERR